MPTPKIITVNEDNLNSYPQVICFINPKNEHHKLKIDWIKKRFDEGLEFRLLESPEDGKICGFIEFIDGKNAWRAVEAENYLFIHCIWINPNKNKNKGYGSILIEEATKEAKKLKKDGVAVITSDGAFMAEKDLFLKNNFEIIEEKDKFQLLSKTFNKNADKPKLIKTDEILKEYKGWNIIYSKQCPWVARSIEEIKPILEEEKIEIKTKELNNPEQVRKLSPSVYSVFTLVKDGKILADHYISTTRFKNILKKELSKK